MTPRLTLSITARAHDTLRSHLFPGDGKEAAAILVCTRVGERRTRLIADEVIVVPHDACSKRTPIAIVWPGDYLEQGVDAAEREGRSLILVHSHPSGFADFSDADDASDKEVVPCLFAAIEVPHGTAVMLPGGRMFGRLYDVDFTSTAFDLVQVAGHELSYWFHDERHVRHRRPMAFRAAMTAELGRLTACVVGVSGTGSIVAEQVCRLGFGRVIGIDPDHVEGKNLNRILNTTKEDADQHRAKVSAFAERANKLRDEPFFEGIPANVLTRQAVLAAAEADVLFCCVDSHRGRMVCDRIAEAFLLPLFDVGVVIPTRKTPNGVAIAEVMGRIDYVYPGGSTLADRQVYTSDSLRAEALAEADPKAHAEQVRRGYLPDFPDEAPSVITLNMRAASACVMEFIARAYPFRQEPNASYARTLFMLAENFEEHEPESAFQASASTDLASGAREPLLGLPALLAKEE